MIFLSVGNAKQGFRRLLEAVDNMAAESKFGDETIFVQSGNNPDFRPRFCQQKAFLSMEEFTECIARATQVICHGGAGTLIHVLQAGKIPVAMPRRKEYKEHVDNHQVELVKALAEKGKVIAALEPADLPGAVAEARHRIPAITNTAQPPVLNIVQQAIWELTNDNSWD